MNRFAFLFAVMAAGLAFDLAAYGQVVVAREDFDGGDLNLISSVVPALDGGPGDYFGVGNRNMWPQGFPSPGVPFSIADDSVFGYANGTPFPGDTEGIYGMNSDLDNHYFAISDSDEFGPLQTAQWTFNISGFTALSVLIDMGGISNDSFGGYGPATDVVFTVQIDGGPIETVFDLDAIDPTGFMTRLMDDGAQSGGGRLLQVSGTNLVEKFLAENGALATNTLLDKTPGAGPGAGALDVFSTALNGSGSTLVLT
ncbi:MAG: hypothetical protein IH986_18570, partial [Planctomycetes bacterium]|nr:hypothetical protein [Planctomycetota bacterium]